MKFWVVYISGLAADMLTVLELTTRLHRLAYHIVSGLINGADFIWASSTCIIASKTRARTESIGPRSRWASAKGKAAK
ncbi:hypothetical protein OH77DRAFT_1522289 [Trametes cingulata]|nr:hypothetical protein OH77DRAFT_1522289 [Trametes cingulata]